MDVVEKTGRARIVDQRRRVHLDRDERALRLRDELPLVHVRAVVDPGTARQGAGTVCQEGHHVLQRAGPQAAPFPPSDIEEDPGAGWKDGRVLREGVRARGLNPEQQHGRVQLVSRSWQAQPAAEPAGLQAFAADGEEVGAGDAEVVHHASGAAARFVGPDAAPRVVAGLDQPGADA